MTTEKLIRVQRRRFKGWRMPLLSRCVTRPGNFGNPYKTAAEFERMLAFYLSPANPSFESNEMKRMRWIAAHVHELRGLNLCCYCPLPKPGEPDHCHAAVLLAFSNVSPNSTEVGK